MRAAITGQAASHLKRRRRPKAGHALLWVLLGVSLTVVTIVVIAVLLGAYVVVALTPKPTKPKELAALIAQPLISQDSATRQKSDAQIQADWTQRILAIQKVSAGNDACASIAREYLAAVSELAELSNAAPSPVPLVRAGAEAWRGAADEDGLGLFFGLLDVGSELAELAAYSEQLDQIHDRLVACRLSTLKLAMGESRVVAKQPAMTAAFAECTLFSSVSVDSLSVRNVSGGYLTNVMLAVDLQGRDGATFSNLFFTAAWAPNQVLVAECSSGPLRETVTDVSIVRCRALTDQLTTSIVEIQVRP